MIHNDFGAVSVLQRSIGIPGTIVRLSTEMTLENSKLLTTLRGFS